MEPIDFNMPPAPKPDGAISRSQALALRLRERQKARKQKRVEKRREKKARKGKKVNSAVLKQIVAQRKDEGVIWIVLMPSERDSQIVGIGAADAAGNIEKIDVNDWKHVEAHEKAANMSDSDE